MKYGKLKQFQLIGKHETIQTKTTNGELLSATNVLIYDHDFIRHVSSHVDRIFVDATFKAFPNLHVKKGQLLTIMAQINNNHGINKVTKKGFSLAINGK